MSDSGTLKSTRAFADLACYFADQESQDYMSDSGRQMGDCKHGERRHLCQTCKEIYEAVEAERTACADIAATAAASGCSGSAFTVARLREVESAIRARGEPQPEKPLPTWERHVAVLRAAANEKNEFFEVGDELRGAIVAALEKAGER